MNDTRERMVTTTAELLQVQGYHATGLNQIIKESKTPKGSLYYHFPGGKEDLADAAVQQAGDAISQLIALAITSTSTAIEGIKMVIAALAQALETSDFHKGCPVATLALETAVSNARLRTTCRDIYRSWQQPMITQLMSEGWLEVEATARATLVLAAIEGAMLLSKVELSTRPLETITDLLPELLS